MSQPVKVFFLRIFLSAISSSKNNFSGSESQFFLVIIIFFGSSFFMTLAGFPAAIVFGGISVVTTDPAPIILFLPTVTPLQTIALSPIHTFFQVFYR